MASNILLNVTYTPIGETHVLVHVSHPKFINHWMLLDLVELSQQSGKSIEELWNNLTKRK